MGSRENIWEMPRDMRTCAGIWGGRQTVWEPAPMADFAHFCNSRERRQGVGAARLDGAATWLAASCRGTGALGECSGMAVTQL